ncbi:MAG: hypothetical protein VR69_12955 [Peptococcaceae bacterium BRH_c4b]|nr:MAG: hypothetical protein VR69_12955 [Peptococcaceae bacterium BRH_c4b]
MNTFILQERESRRLGDKTEYLYDIHNSSGGIDEVIAVIKNILKKEGVTPELVLKDEKRMGKFEEIRKQAGLTASQRQEDVLLFIEKVLKTLSSK